VEKAINVSDRLFQSNFNKFKQITPSVALKMQYIDPSDWTWCKSRTGELNLEYRGEKEAIPLHSAYSPSKEAEKWFQGLKLTNVNVLYVYGVGLGYYYDAAKQWLAGDPGRYLVFLEDDMAVMRRLFETDQGEKILNDRQVQIHYFYDLEQGLPMIDWITWYFINTKPDVSCLELYQKMKSDQADALRSKILHEAVVKESLAGEYGRFGAGFFRNFYPNMLYLEESYHGQKLFGQFKDVPAIICGAGPSLNKNYPVLEKLTSKALVFSGGSALNALGSRGFIPHFGAGIDPNPTQHSRIISNFGYEVPFFYRNRMNHKAFRAIHGPTLYVNGTGGYRVSEWFEHELGIHDDDLVDEGHNVINFLIDIATHLGCNPIVLVGMDLAYTGMKSYAEGVVSDEKVSQEKITSKGDTNSAAFPRKDIYGNETFTLWKWVNEAHWIGEFAKARPHVTYINATEGGLGFPGIPNMTLQDVENKYLQRNYDLWGRVHTEIQNAKFESLSSDKVIEKMKIWYDGMRRAKELCELLLEETNVIEEQIKKGKQFTDGLQTGKGSLYEIEFTELITYKNLLNMLGFAHQKLLEREKHQIKHDWTLKSETDRNLKLNHLKRINYSFLRDAAVKSIELMEYAIEDYQKAGHKVDNFVVQPYEVNHE
jgi:hypothetical protein